MRAQEFIVENQDQAAVDALLKKHGWSVGKTSNGDPAFTWQGSTYVFYGERVRITLPNGKSVSVVWGKQPDWQGRPGDISFAQALQNKYITFDLPIWQALDRGQINDAQALQQFKAENERQAREAIAQGVNKGSGSITELKVSTKTVADPQAAGCILYAEDTGRWGLQQRSDTVGDPGLWAAWGGGREPGETLEQTARRELAEESGYRGPIKLEPLARNAKYMTFIGIVPHEFEPQPCDEWKDYCWVELGKWPTPMHPGVAAALENVYIKESANDPTQQDLQDVAGWMHTTPEELSIEVRQEPIEKFMRQIREMYGTYDEFPEDEERTNRILKLLKRGAKPLPIYVEANDPDLFVMEGRHRMVAFWLSGMTTIPVAYVSVKGQQDVTEAFNKPYKGKWEKSESGSYDMLARLPDGTNLSIMFNNEGGGEWQVEFYRNNSQEVTGEGDAQRIFATVLGAIQKFIKKHNPLQITFSASKEVEPGQNSESRAKLYNRLVDRYAASWGYDSRHFDHGDQVTYELSRYPSDGPFESTFTENFADGKVRGKSRPGRVKRSGASCAGSVTDLRARAKKYGGERGRMYHWCANMKSGKKNK